MFPKKLKTAKVTPIFKSGSKEKTNNYRPISVLSPFSKIFEKLIHKRLSKFFCDNNAICKEQFGFRSEHSASLLSADVTTTLQTNLDKKLFTCAIFLDLSKEFDTVGHDILLKKVEYYGIRGNIKNLLNDYLNVRKQMLWSSPRFNTYAAAVFVVHE